MKDKSFDQIESILLLMFFLGLTHKSCFNQEKMKDFTQKSVNGLIETECCILLFILVFVYAKTLCKRVSWSMYVHVLKVCL